MTEKQINLEAIKQARKVYQDENGELIVDMPLSVLEKKEELLGLYRNHHYHLLQGNVAPMLRIRDKISKLERELDE